MLLAIPPGQRIWLLQLLAKLPDDARLQDGDDQRGDIFDAIVSMDVDLSDLRQADRWRTAALEAAVVKYPGNLSGPCEKIRKRLKQAKQGAPRLEGLVSEARKILAALNAAYRQSQDMPTITTVRALFPDAPVSEEVRVPAGWNISSNGITEVGVVQVVVARGPILITERCRNHRDDVQYVTLSWLVDGQWRSRVFPRSVIADRTGLVKLAEWGLPVHSNNASALVAYLADYEAENRAFLPNTICTDQQGWLTIGGEEVFLCGDTVIRKEPDSDEEESDAGSAGVPSVRFMASDTGNQQIAQALQPKGKFHEWQLAAQQLEPFPRVLLALFASLAAPLLKILRLACFIVDFAGETSIGKTTSLRVAVSVWGNPWESGSGTPSLMYSWDATPVFLERLPEILQSIPAVVDETKRAYKGADFVTRVIYSFGAGQGRGRGSLDGVRHLRTWMTVMIISGEQPVTSFTRDGGTHARVIEVWGLPFGNANEVTGVLVAALLEKLRDNYGHAGPHFVQWLIDHRDRWNDFRQRFRELKAILMTHAANKPIAMRLCESMAAICLAEELAHEALGLPTGKMVELCSQLLQQATETDRAAEALRYVLGWASANQGRFYRGTVGGAHQGHPAIGVEYVGRWDEPAAEWIGIFAHVLEQVLEDGGFDLDSIVACWQDRGWLQLEQEGGRTRTRIRTRVGDNPNARVIAILRSAIDQVDPPGPDAANAAPETGVDEEGDDPDDGPDDAVEPDEYETDDEADTEEEVEEEEEE